MIDWWQAAILAVIQGLTEFLPISSSAHLVIPSLVLGWPDQGLAFDVAVHVGTLVAVVLYFRSDLLNIAGAWLRSLSGGGISDESRLGWYLIAGTIPAGLVGLLAGDLIEAHLRTLPVLATTTLLFGLLLGLADRRARAVGGAVPITFAVAMLVGLAQALAPVPGVSRSGVTMTAALMLGTSRQDAARFSFLLSVPIIAAAGLLMAGELLSASAPVNWPLFVFATLVSGITAYLCIALFLRLLDRIGLMPFVYYRVALGLLLYGLWISL